MIAGSRPPLLDDNAMRMAEIERRLARIEEHLRIADAATRPDGVGAATKATEDSPLSLPVRAPATDDLEFELGQNWFARTGILALIAGAVFLLLLPHAGLPPAVPSLIGLVAVAILFAVTRLAERGFELVSRYLRGAAMVLLYCSIVRLFYFGERPALSVTSVAGRGLLVLVVALNLALALRRRSLWLTALALLTGYATVLALREGWFPLGALLVVTGTAAVCAEKYRWPALRIGAPVLAIAAYVGWAALNAPPEGNRLAAEPAGAPWVVLGVVLIVAGVPIWRTPRVCDSPAGNVAALVTCGLGYAAFLLHSYATFGPAFAPAHGVASVLFLAIAVVYWMRCQSHVVTFFYAMTGYAALSVAILKATTTPDVFVWLSLQSLLVVATAIWFRSRFIVVANFAIYVAIVLGYMVVKRSETGISIGFGIVALLSARLLNAQKHRLELKTELMRDAYLFSGFVVFPYALFHLVSPRYVGLAWVGLALGYYGLSFLFRNHKYRWMGHGTLVVTLAYLVLAGSRQFEPAFRIASFLALGTVLLIVSLAFTRLRQGTKNDQAR